MIFSSKTPSPLISLKIQDTTPFNYRPDCISDYMNKVMVERTEKVEKVFKYLAKEMYGLDLEAMDKEEIERDFMRRSKPVSTDFNNPIISDEYWTYKGEFMMRVTEFTPPDRTYMEFQAPIEIKLTI